MVNKNISILKLSCCELSQRLVPYAQIQLKLFAPYSIPCLKLIEIFPSTGKHLKILLSNKRR